MNDRRETQPMDSSNDLLTATRSAASTSPASDTERSYLLVLEGGNSRMFHLPRHGTVLIGQPGPATPALIVMGQNSPVTAMAWNPDGDRLLAGCEDGTLHVADFRL